MLPAFLKACKCLPTTCSAVSDWLPHQLKLYQMFYTSPACFVWSWLISIKTLSWLRLIIIEMLSKLSCASIFCISNISLAKTHEILVCDCFLEMTSNIKLDEELFLSFFCRVVDWTYTNQLQKVVILVSCRNLLCKVITTRLSYQMNPAIWQVLA